MFKELAPYLRQRAILLTVTHRRWSDQCQHHPEETERGREHRADHALQAHRHRGRTRPRLALSIVDFVAPHLQLKSTLERAKAEMDAAGKAAQAEARAKKVPTKKDEPAKPAAAMKPIEAAKPEPPKTFSLFDAPAAETPVTQNSVDEEEEILAEAGENQVGEEEDEEVDEAA